MSMSTKNLCYSFLVTNIKATLKSDPNGMMNKLTSEVSNIDFNSFTSIIDGLLNTHRVTYCCQHKRCFVIKRDSVRSPSDDADSPNLTCYEGSLTSTQKPIQHKQRRTDRAPHAGCCKIPPKPQSSKGKRNPVSMYYTLPRYSGNNATPSISSDSASRGANININSKKRSVSLDDSSSMKGGKKRKTSPDTQAKPTIRSAPSTSDRHRGPTSDVTFIHSDENFYATQRALQRSKRTANFSHDQKGQNDFAYDSALSEFANANQHNIQASPQKELEYKRFIKTLGHFSNLGQHNQVACAARGRQRVQGVQDPVQHAPTQQCALMASTMASTSTSHSQHRVHFGEAINRIGQPLQPVQFKQLQQLQPQQNQQPQQHHQPQQPNRREELVKQSFHTLAMENSRITKEKINEHTTLQDIVNNVSENANFSINPQLILDMNKQQTLVNPVLLSDCPTNVVCKYLQIALDCYQPAMEHAHILSEHSANLSVQEKEARFVDMCTRYIDLEMVDLDFDLSEQINPLCRSDPLNQHK
ncbi:hypothetical protein E3P91_02250 [Wallemia ichthyophaga]|nr:hypothetical protein E3P91_02250 [Wallemia ichthyophaga]